VAPAARPPRHEFAVKCDGVNFLEPRNVLEAARSAARHDDERALRTERAAHSKQL
jgi:hypothetical protein